GEFQEILTIMKASTQESPTPLTPPSESTIAQSGDLVVKIERTSEWNSGFCEEVEVYNTTQEPKIWSVEIDVVGEIYTLWNAHYQHDGSSYKLSASGVDFNRAVGANSSVSFGYCVNKESQSTPPTPSSTQTNSYSFDGLEVTQKIQSDWESGYCSDVIISNQSSEDKLWSVSFEAAGRVNDLWNAHYTQDPQSLVIEAQGVEYNQVVKANETVTIGYCASKLSSLPTTSPTSISTPTPTIEPTPSPTLQPSPSPTPQPTQTPVVEDEQNVSSDKTLGYRDALDLSMSFYEAQRASGPFERVTWREAIASGDGSDVGVDLDGGWFDAGDHVKFNLPMSYSATMLIWSMIDYPDSYKEIDYSTAQVKYALDYLLRSYDAGQIGQYGDDKLYYQVGDGNADHDFWGPPEDINMQRPTATCSGDEGGCAAVSGSMAAAFASGYLLFASSDATFANQLLDSAKEIYAYAKAYPTDNDYTAASPFYQLFDDNKDQLAWGAIWLYLATNETQYLNDAKSYIANKSPTGWVHSWDNVTTGVYLLLAQITNENSYHSAMQQSINHWISSVPSSPAGLRVISEWGSLRYASTQAFIASKYASLISDSTLQSSYLDFARLQIDYILGDNPLNFSYQIGFGTSYPLNPHHRGAHASPTHTISSPANNTYTLVGALVGGPLSPDDYDYQDDRSDYKRNEVATDYNAGFSAALATLIALEE
ncbi:MAG: glycoside hydrolase family 9 protein, partial [Campylobacterota bacterium]|nr:glycoside hydrolase family 9 protein [Campylobacterota bacterium]